MNGIIDSISPQVKVHGTNIMTGSAVLGTALQYIPITLGIIATLVGIVTSIVITIRASKQLKMDKERHDQESLKRKLEIKLLKKQIKTLD